MSEKRTAIHEAGHQVAAFRQGFEISTLSIDGDGETLGRAFSATDYYNEEGATKSVTVSCAGYAALIADPCSPSHKTHGLALAPPSGPGAFFICRDIIQS